ncbi:transporter substrate-binding domain-containing protein [Pseudomonas sp. H9]|uniref:transporter substrate-binding domain-containing protein n=1 Tax=Pseudomonas sp. H9 TaxID=483968 RepID=UPI00105776DE|nr:transporter substrate-binding domain-containing protein [Pseudomonas sp. H9]TDF86203.1 transporter substrate-binding domain-containing protein [Pseudomonas sp. H9]
MKLKSGFSALALMSAVALFSHVQASERTLRIGVEAAYPPFAYKTPDNQLVGFDYDIGEALCAKLQAKCKWIEIEFDGLIPSLKVRKIDAAISSVSITEERLKSVDFTSSYYRLPARVVTRKDSGIGNVPGDLAGKRIGVQRATNFDRYATERFASSGAQIVKYGSQNEVFLDLLSGRLDAALAGSVAIEEGLFKVAGGSDYHFVGEPFTEEKYFGTGAGIAVRKKDPLASELNQALQAIHDDGTYDAIRKKYFQYDISGNP